MTISDRVYNRSSHILVVDDDDTLLKFFKIHLNKFFSRVLVVHSASDAMDALKEKEIDLVISDIRMPRIDGLQLLARIRAIDPDIPVILITGHADVPMAVGALRDGAFDFLTKPFAADHLIAAARRALESRRLVLDNRRLREAALIAEDSHPLIGDTPVMRRLRDTIGEIARADFDVLIEGETGTGKELAALFLHRWGPRRGRPFVAVNCGALDPSIAEAELFGIAPGATGFQRGAMRDGRIAGADKGTLFLDEIDSMAPEVQVKLLRVLEEREVTAIGAEHPRAIDVRVIAAAKRDLAEAVRAGDFRDDLFYRLNVIRLRIPPLRERRDDIPLLFAHFLALAAEQVGRAPPAIGAAARRHLIEHDWQGNVRELRNFAFRITLNLDDGAAAATEAPASLPQRIERFEAAALREALTAAKGDIRKTLTALGMPRNTLYDKLARHAIDPAAYRSGHGRG